MNNKDTKDLKDIYQIHAKAIDGSEVSFDRYKNKVMLIVNVASKCGFTNQYSGLEQLYRKYKDRGLVVLGFPCNQFGAQEPGDEAEIKNFCSLNYDVTFPMFGKVDVNGTEAHELYKYLKSEKAGVFGTEVIKWNFTKFLVDAKGNVVDRFAPTTKPDELNGRIESTLSSVVH